MDPRHWHSCLRERSGNSTQERLEELKEEEMEPFPGVEGSGLERKVAQLQRSLSGVQETRGPLGERQGVQPRASPLLAH